MYSCTWEPSIIYSRVLSTVSFGNLNFYLLVMCVFIVFHNRWQKLHQQEFVLEYQRNGQDALSLAHTRKPSRSSGYKIKIMLQNGKTTTDVLYLPFKSLDVYLLYCPKLYRCSGIRYLLLSSSLSWYFTSLFQLLKALLSDYTLQALTF